MVDIPFVSEDFQRAYRNQFPSQTSTGRDLHVSDVVIPIVDFTPTSSGASLPLDLRACLNNNTSLLDISSDQTNTVITSTAGFYQVIYNYSGQNATVNTAKLSFNILNSTTSSTNDVYAVGFYGNDVDKSNKDSFVVYIPANNSFRLTMANSQGGSIYNLYVITTQIADVNGNLQNPSGYNPQ